MEQQESHDAGWAFVAETDGVAALLGTILTLDPQQRYTRSELASAAEVPLKQLYLSDALGELAELGVLDAVDTEGEGETTYEIADDSPIYAAAQEFEAAVRAASSK